ncbi:MAG: HlyD family efflux transporter periplasmic adaptor subunit [Acidobacteria bacterium]|nr:HlyD family efflux transporter periplasmic adaptor subunit [Acidobacteriota bacterium]
MRLKSLPTVIILSLVLTAAACSNGRGDGRIHASGHIEATEVRLAATVGGRLLDAPLREGDPVHAGEVVARLDTTDARLELARAHAEAEVADARLRLLLKGTRLEDLDRAEQRLAQAQAELDAATRDYHRLEGLARKGTATAKARDDAGTRRDVAKRQVLALRAELAKLTAGPRREEIDIARAQRAAARAVVAEVQQRITDATVFAPRDGVITTRVAEPGEVLPPGAPIAVLTDLAHPWLNVYVDEPSLSRIHLGDIVEVRVDGQSKTFRGRVSFVSPVAEFTPKNVQTPEERAKLVFKVKVALDNPNGVFKPGMPADAYFSAHERSGR